MTVPSSCWPPSGPPRPPHAPHSCSEDSGSDGSSASHATSPGSSSPDVYALQPLSPARAPGYHGAWGPDAPRPSLLLPPGPFPAELYVLVPEGCLPPGEAGRVALEEERLAQRLQQLQLLQQHVRPRGRPARAPSLKDSPAGRALCRAAVTQELQSWHERARLRGARPHSLDRQGAFRLRSLPLGRPLGPRTQVRATRVPSGPRRAAGPPVCRPGDCQLEGQARTVPSWLREAPGSPAVWRGCPEG